MFILQKLDVLDVKRDKQKVIDLRWTETFRIGGGGKKDEQDSGHCREKVSVEIQRNFKQVTI